MKCLNLEQFENTSKTECKILTNNPVLNFSKTTKI